LSGLGKAGSLGITPENCEIHTHNLKVIGSNPIPATNPVLRMQQEFKSRPFGRLFFLGRVAAQHHRALLRDSILSCGLPDMILPRG
jgi:hypothetical protein